MRNIVLVGLMGAGKSSVGKLLARKLKLEFIDTDLLIECAAQTTISEIFSKYGEKHFRNLESSVIQDVSQKNDMVVSTGGGAIEDENNLCVLKKNGVVFYLEASPENLYLRIKNETHRPLLHTENPLDTLKKLLQKREKQYQAADFIIDTNNKNIELITQEVIKVYDENNKY